MNLFRVLSGFYNMLKFSLSGVHYGKNFRCIGRCGLVNKGTILIGDRFRCSSGDFANAIGSNLCSYIKADKGALISIGDRVGISSATIWSSVSITIGDNVKIGAQSVIVDTDAHSIDPLVRMSGEDGKQAKRSPVVIKNNVWLGMRVIVCKGVTIGENSVVGAGSVVTCSIPDNQVWAGNPARFLKEISI